MEEIITHSGFVAIVGCPNVGKSTLMNRVVGQKVAIVSAKPQTTRNRILGVLTEGGKQIVFLDTPGIHRPRTKLGDYMMRQVDNSTHDMDAVVLVVEPNTSVPHAETNLISNISCPVILAINKIDEVRKDTLLSVISTYAQAHSFHAILPISAKTGEGVDMLMEQIASLLQEGPAYFPTDMFTDQSERQMLAEFVREKALHNLSEEVPHGIAVEIEEFHQREDGLLEVGAVIYCEKKTHKGIIIGKDGEVLKRISTAARLDMQRLMGCKIYLRVFVKVREGWRDSERFIRTVGYRDD